MIGLLPGLAVLTSYRREWLRADLLRRAATMTAATVGPLAATDPTR